VGLPKAIHAGLVLYTLRLGKSRLEIDKGKERGEHEFEREKKMDSGCIWE